MSADLRRQAVAPTNAALLGELRQLIAQARAHVAQTANSTLTLLYWRVGTRIQREVLQDGRADYGAQIVSTLSTQLVREYGQGFGLRSLRRIERWSVRTLRERIASQLYLRWLDRHDRAEGEEPPIGLILCVQADGEQVELLDLRHGNIRVAEYLTRIPDMNVLREQLHRSVQRVREQLARAALPLAAGPDGEDP